MKRAKSICSHPGCNVLLDLPGRCEQHKKTFKEFNRKELDSRKTTKDRKFYSSSKWTKTSLAHRAMEPLCQRCYKKGKRVEGNLVHHEPDRKVLVAKGISPFDHRYLVTLCNNCHLQDLRDKRFNIRH